jgi:hypothetical protein
MTKAQPKSKEQISSAQLKLARRIFAQHSRFVPLDLLPVTCTSGGR